MSEEAKSGLLSKVIGPKRRWRQYKARVRRLSAPYRTAVDGIEHYIMLFGPVTGDSAAALLDDVADLFERAAVDGTPIRTLVGEDPVEFVEALIRNYDKGGYVARAQNRLIGAIERAEAEEAGTGEAASG
jgi:DNA-binding ferritin-like protein (Dps family)